MNVALWLPWHRSSVGQPPHDPARPRFPGVAGNAGARGSLALAVGLCIALAAGCGRAPQLGSDDDSWAAADALWTAVAAKRQDLLSDSAAQIDRLHAAARLPDDAFDRLSSVVGTARAGDWSQARTTLKTFIQGQRPATR